MQLFDCMLRSFDLEFRSFYSLLLTFDSVLRLLYFSLRIFLFVVRFLAALLHSFHSLLLLFGFAFRCFAALLQSFTTIYRFFELIYILLFGSAQRLFKKNYLARKLSLIFFSSLLIITSPNPNDPFSPNPALYITSIS